MKSFTTCASVANKFFKVLQGYTKGIRFVAVLTMLLIVGIGQAWAETKTYSYTFSAKQFSANGSKTLSNVSWTLAGDGGYWGYDATKGQQFGSSGDPYKTLTLSTSGISGTITKIIINTSGASSVNASFTVSVGGTQWGNSTKLTTTATAYTFTGSNSGEIKFSYTQTSSKALYIKSISVTYETAASYTVTYNANGGSGTMSNSTGSSIKIKECTFTAPGCKQFTSWNTAANGSGTSYAPNATVATNLTLYAQWENLPSYTVKLMDNNEVLTSSCNTPISLPDRNCDGYTFVGWTKTWTEEQEEWTTTAPAIIPAGSYTPTANESLYPVYTKTEGGGSEPTAYSAGDVGSFIIASNVGNKWYAIPENPTLSSSKITGVEITVSQTAGGVNYVSTANAEGYTWTIADATNGQTISDGSKYIYHSNGGASGTNLTYGTSTSFTWKIEKENNGLTFQGMNASTTNSRGLLFNGSVFGGYALSNEDASGYYRIQVLPIGGGSTTYYISVPECITETSR